jgi:hypothetical protein
MATIQRQSLSGAKATANLKQTALVNSVAKLFKAGFAPGVTNTLASFVANECDFDDYAPIVMATWNEPTLSSLPGYNIDSALLRWVCAADQVVGNSVGGMWFETAGGLLLDFVVLDPPIDMMLEDQALEWLPLEFFPAQ